MPNETKRSSPNVTIYNISKKLVSEVPQRRYEAQIRFKYPDAFDGYAGVTVPRDNLSTSANPNFYHFQVPKTYPLTLTYKTGIGAGATETREITPREFKTLFEATRTPKKKPEVSARQQQIEQDLNAGLLHSEPGPVPQDRQGDVPAV